ncbi:DUF4097 family beta strand repeat-containing protein [Frateuria defendens]|uniref:DUF4097 family beta strand repeat-containing protein n=1 Tax=Frateuria defendens TaxID=2219559 RepID=UPI00066FB87E|nr:DUF4097 family beta strand repeat-containing protein [Frateuria defendens]
MRRIALSLLLFVPLAALAEAPCKYEAPRNLSLDLAGVRAIEVELGAYDLHLRGEPGAKGLEARGRACASEQRLLDQLTVTQRREGDRVVLGIGTDRGGFSFFGGGETRLEVDVTVPAGLPVTLGVGSGDAEVAGVRELDSHVGSGDLHVRGIAGRFAISVGSGDVVADDLGSLEVGAVGSGDLKASHVRGDVRVGSIGSGDVTLRQVGGSVHADTLGSGDLDVADVGGDFSLGAKGSGDVSHQGVKGRVSVPVD